jgi:hypothetical protein
MQAHQFIQGQVDWNRVVEFWKQIYDIDISPDEIPLLKVKMVNSEATFTYPPSFLLVCLRCSEAALSE